jgi:hypothetical protein
MLINRLYDSFVEDSLGSIELANHSIEDYLEKIIQSSSLRYGFANLQLYSDKLIRPVNKYYFTDYISKLYINKI